MEMEEALLSVHEDVDMPPLFLLSTKRNPERPKMIPRSVVRPGFPQMPQELQIRYQP